jgi:sterol desaturase/sphingolipid hydroxylase (fatty acid hydroxylase superfamily)
MPKFSPIDYAVPAFILLILIEMIIARRRDPTRYEARDTLTSLLLGTGSTVAGALTGGIVFALALKIYDLRLFDVAGTWGWAWWVWGLCFLFDDFTYYWQHRFAHRVRWFWAAHVNHHSSQHYNLSTALRQPWTSFVALTFIFRIPIAFIGFDPLMILTCGAINLIYQFWIHTEVIGRLPKWVEAVMNTPSHHRVHHAVNPRYLDRNYAGTFIIWDRMFGTFAAEVDEDKPRYGIVKQLGSFNLLWAVFHEWVGIARDLWAAPWRHKLSYVWREPGWTHDGSRMTSDMIRARWQAQQTD